MKMYCTNCGNVFYSPPSFFTYPHFCSDDCKFNFFERHRRELDALCRSKGNLFEKQCAYCGKEFFTSVNRQKYCCEEHTRLAQKQARKAEYALAAKEFEKLKAEVRPEREKPKRTFEQTAREADEVGLSYGKYKTALMFGKTYDELKAEYERRNFYD